MPVSAQQLGLGRGTVGAVLVIPIRGVGSPGALMRSRPEEANGDTNRTWRSLLILESDRSRPRDLSKPAVDDSTVDRTSGSCLVEELSYRFATGC